MSVRLWRKNGPMISVEGRKGYFDVAYGTDSPAQNLDVFLPEGIRFDEVIDGGTNDIEAAALRFLEHLDD